jgi:hypothetical protein
MTSRGRLKPRIATVAISALFALAGASEWPAVYAQAKNAPAKSGMSTITGCVQSAQGEGFVLLNPQGRPAANKTQTLTYKLVAAGKNVDLAAMANKRVQVTGTLSTKPAGNVPAPVPDSVRGTGGAGGSGKPGVDNASYFANGVFTVQSIKEMSGTCAGDAGKARQ